jgi:hypothetical protein
LSAHSSLDFCFWNIFFANLIEMDKNIINVNTTLSEKGLSQWNIYTTIGFVYLFFINSLINRIIGDEYEKKCGDISYCPINNFSRSCISEEGRYGEECNEIENRKKDCEQLRKELNNKKFIGIVSIGVSSILLGTYMTMMTGEYATAGIGIGFGGALGVLWQTFANWNDLSQDSKLVITGSALAVLIYGSSKVII